MCLIIFSYKNHSKYPLIIAANRDEYYSRPTKPADFWEDHPTICGGIDEKFSGTWLGITQTGTIGMITNYRNPNSHREGLHSRGLLIKSYLTGKMSDDKFISNIQTTKDDYNGYNLLFGNMNNFYWYSNTVDEIKKITPGIFGLSNHLLDSPWPKVMRGKKLLSQCMERPEMEISAIMDILKDREIPDDAKLPATGVGLEIERVLSPIFITSPIYGTRSSTVILVDENGEVTFREDTYHPKEEKFTKAEFSFQIR